MTMPSSGPISIGMAINEEQTSGASPAPHAGDASLSNLAGVTPGTRLAWSMWYGKSALPNLQWNYLTIGSTAGYVFGFSDDNHSADPNPNGQVDNSIAGTDQMFGAINGANGYGTTTLYNGRVITYLVFNTQGNYIATGKGYSGDTIYLLNPAGQLVYKGTMSRNQTAFDFGEIVYVTPSVVQQLASYVGQTIKFAFA